MPSGQVWAYSCVNLRSPGLEHIACVALQAFLSGKNSRENGFVSSRYPLSRGHGGACKDEEWHRHLGRSETRKGDEGERISELGRIGETWELQSGLRRRSPVRCAGEAEFQSLLEG